MGSSGGQAISVHLVDLPQMLEDAVRDALGDESFDVTGGPPGQVSSARRTVVVMQTGTDMGRWSEQLMLRPDASILLIEPRACHAELIELHPARRSLGAVDATAIAAAVRSAVRWDDRVTSMLGGAGA